VEYHVARLEIPPEINANWDAAAWGAVASTRLDRHIGPKAEFQPVTNVKLGYDEGAVYVIFRVQERVVRCGRRERHGAVCKDSCVEFFFTPAADSSRGYFNLETNCGGTMLFHFQEKPRCNTVQIDDAGCCAVNMACSLPAVVDPEVTSPLVWTLEYRLPLTVLEQHFAIDRPAPGVVWRANFFKCASDTSNPHWLTWAPIERDELDYHVPECFGTLIFD